MKPKTCLCSLILLLISFTSDAQEQVWRKFFGGTGAEELYHIRPTPDGGALLTGSTTSFGQANNSLYNGTANSGNTLVIKTDSLGIMQWQVVWDTLKYTTGISSAVNDAGEYFVTGTVYTDNSLNDIFVLKLSPTGEVLWSQVYGGALAENCTGIESAGNDVVICGNTQSFGQGQNDIFLFKIDPSGNQLWTKTIGSLVTEYAHGFNKVHDGGFIICGYYSTASYNDGYIARTDANGDSIWTKIIPIGGSNICRYYSCTELKGDSSFAVVGRGGSNYGTYYASRIGMNGNVINHFTQSGYLRFVDWVAATNDGGFITTGYPFTKFNYKAEREWESGDLSSYYHTIVPLPDGSYYLGGERNGNFAPTNYDIELAKTNEIGFSINFPTIPIEETPDVSHCYGDSASLSTANGFDHYQWIIATGQYTNELVEDYGDYQLTTDLSGVHSCLLWKDNELYFSENESVIIYQENKPQLNHTGQISYCGMDTTVILSIANAIATTKQWYLNGNPIPGANNINWTPTVSGNYHAMVNHLLCDTVSSDTVFVDMDDIPNLEISPDTSWIDYYTQANSPCDTAFLTIPLQQGYNYRWFRNGIMLPGTSNVFAATQAGNYHALVYNSCGYDTTEIVTVLNDSITMDVSVSGPLNGCGSETTTLSVPYVSQFAYVWYRVGGNAVGFSADFQPNYIGDFYCRIAVYCGNTLIQYVYTDTISYNYIRYNNPSITFQGLVPTICANDSVRLNCNGIFGASYQWFVDSIPIPNTDTLVYWAKSTGSYYCAAIIPNCDTVNSHPFFVRHGLPEAYLTVDDTILCPNQSVRIYAHSPDLVYIYGSAVWTLDGVVLPNYNNNSSIYINQPGVYQCTVANLCGSILTNTVTIYNAPNPVTITSSTGGNFFCKGDSVTLQATDIPGYTYQWYKGSGSGVIIPGATSSAYQALTNGIYQVKYNTGLCDFTSSITLNQTNIINANILAHSPLFSCGPGPVTLEANSRADLAYTWKKDGVIVPGANAILYDAPTTGKYQVVITDSLGCDYTSPEVSVSFEAMSDFAIYTSTGMTVACNGDSLMLHAGINSPSYQWLKDFQPVAGGNDDSLIVFDAGFYSVQVTNGLGCTGQANIIIAEADFFGGGANITHEYCNDLSGEISYGVGGYIHQFLWDSGETVSTLSGLSAGTYIATLTDRLGCTYVDTNIVLDLDSVPVTIAGSIDKCEGSNYTIYPQGGVFSSYLWSTGDTTFTINPQLSGIYTVTVTNANGCPGSDSAQVTIHPLPVITITPGGPTGICLGDSLKLEVDSGLSNHRWYRYGVLQSPYSAIFYAKYRGDYTCRASDSNGCYDTSAAINVTIICLPPLDPVEKTNSSPGVSDWSVFPNPSSGDFYLSSPDGFSGKEIIQIYNLAGQEVAFRKIQDGENKLRLTILSNGIYFLLLSNDQQTQRFKLVVSN